MANSAIVGIINGGGGGNVSLEPNQFKTLKFNLVPAVMEFGISIGTGTDPVVLKGSMNAAAIKAALEGSDDMEGFTVDVYGSTTTSTGADGVALHSGKFIIAVNGAGPFPAWAALQSAEVQSFIVEEGDDGGFEVNGAGADSCNGQYGRAGSNEGKPVYLHSSGNGIFWSNGYWRIGVFSEFSTAYMNSADTPEPPLTGWSVAGGASPAPTLSMFDTYTLNGGSPFLLSTSESALQTNQRALTGSYAEVVVKGNSAGATYPNVTASGWVVAGFNSYPFSHSGFVDSAPRFANSEGFVIRWMAANSRWEIWGGDYIFCYDIGGGDINGWVGPWQEEGGGTNADGGVISPLVTIPSFANFNSYFPFVVGNVSDPAASGTNAVVSTLYQGGSTSSLVTATEATIEELLISGLILPESTAPVGAYTPANSGHWSNPDPTTTTEAIDRLAAAFNDWIGPV